MSYAPGSTGDCRSIASAAERPASRHATCPHGETSASIGRRELIKLSVAGIAAAGVTIAPAKAAPVAIDLTIDDLVVTMVDGTRLNALGFGLAGAVRVPGPVIRVKEG